jgi:hypothetical protein
MKVNGLKTAVKAGEMTPEEALKKIEEWNKSTPWLIPQRTVRWLKNRMP